MKQTFVHQIKKCRICYVFEILSGYYERDCFFSSLLFYYETYFLEIWYTYKTFQKIYFWWWEKFHLYNRKRDSKNEFYKWRFQIPSPQSVFDIRQWGSHHWNPTIWESNWLRNSLSIMLDFYCIFYLFNTIPRQCSLHHFFTSIFEERLVKYWIWVIFYKNFK